MRRPPLPLSVSSLRSKLALLAWLVVATMGACSLNPQPIPPGFQDPQDSPAFASDASATPGPTPSRDAGNGGIFDEVDADADAPLPVVDASTSLDAGPDTSSDAATDAASDDGSVPADALAD